MKHLASTSLLPLLILSLEYLTVRVTSELSKADPYISSDQAKVPKTFYHTQRNENREVKVITAGYPDSSEEDEDEVSNEVSCHRVAVSRCGHILIRVYKFLDYLNAREAFQPRCAFREAFFKCMKVSKEKYCSHRKSVRDHIRFRERLAKTLWSTRTCILGSLDYYY